jgi:hypothetical protein
MTQLVAQLYVSGAEYMVPLITALEGPRNRLRAYLESNLAFIEANKNYVAAMTDVVVNLRDADGKSKFANPDGEREVLEPLVMMLREGQETGIFGEFDVVIMAKSIRDSIDSAAGRGIREADFDMSRYSAHLWRLFDLATRKAGNDD